MSDWKSVAPVFANAFAVVTLNNGMLRVAFGEGIIKGEEPVFHGAILVDRKSAQLLVGPYTEGPSAAPKRGR
jgi:hypothetical protein